MAKWSSEKPVSDQGRENNTRNYFTVSVFFVWCRYILINLIFFIQKLTYFSQHDADTSVDMVRKCASTAEKGEQDDLGEEPRRYRGQCRWWRLVLQPYLNICFTKATLSEPYTALIRRSENSGRLFGTSETLRRENTLESNVSYIKIKPLKLIGKWYS